MSFRFWARLLQLGAKGLNARRRHLRNGGLELLDLIHMVGPGQRHEVSLTTEAETGEEEACFLDGR